MGLCHGGSGASIVYMNERDMNQKMSDIASDDWGETLRWPTDEDIDRWEAPEAEDEDEPVYDPDRDRG